MGEVVEGGIGVGEERRRGRREWEGDEAAGRIVGWICVCVGVFVVVVVVVVVSLNVVVWLWGEGRCRRDGVRYNG